MIRNIYNIFAFIYLFSSSSLAQIPEWEWAKEAGGSANDYSTSSCLDPDGNLYVTGYFLSSSIEFDSITLINNGQSNTTDIFLTKYDGNGNVLWAKNFGGDTNDIVRSIAVDPQGGVYITGGFQSELIILGNDTLRHFPTMGNFDVFFIKFDADGNILWAEDAGSEGDDIGYDIFANSSGKIVIVGSFNSPQISFPGFTFYNHPPSLCNCCDAFVVQYNFNGAPVNGRSFGDLDNDYAINVNKDTLGNIYVSGSFESDSIHLDAVRFDNYAEEDIYLLKLDQNLNGVWVKCTGGIGNEQPWSMDVSKSGEVFMSGIFYSDSLFFDTIKLLRTSGMNNCDMFIVNYEPDGSVSWAKSFGGPGNEVATSVLIDDSNNVFLGGKYSSPTILFDSVSLTNSGNFDLFIAKFKNDGNVQWVKTSSHPFSDELACINRDENNNLYVVGYFRGDSIQLGSEILTNVASTTSEILIAKLSHWVGIDKIDFYVSNLKIAPNPATQQFIVYAKTSNVSMLEIFNSLGEKIFSSTYRGPMTVDCGHFPRGLYFVHLSNSENQLTQKLIVE